MRNCNAADGKRRGSPQVLGRGALEAPVPMHAAGLQLLEPELDASACVRGDGVKIGKAKRVRQEAKRFVHWQRALRQNGFSTTSMTIMIISDCRYLVDYPIEFCDADFGRRRSPLPSAANNPCTADSTITSANLACSQPATYQPSDCQASQSPSIQVATIAGLMMSLEQPPLHHLERFGLVRSRSAAQ